MKRLILASQSPRRKEILESLGVSFLVSVSQVNEQLIEGETPEELVRRLALLKARSVAQQLKQPVIVIGSDTVVTIDSEILFKPHDENEAFKMLKKLSGRCHKVYTGLALVDPKEQRFFVDYEITNVYMKSLTSEEIESYIKTGEPLDKAGAYGIQGLGAVFIEKIEGDYFSVMGLPKYKLFQGMKQLGYNLFDWL